MSTLVFIVRAIGVSWGKAVSLSEHEARRLLSNRHRSRSLFQGETFNTNAVQFGEALCPASPTICLAMSLVF